MTRADLHCHTTASDGLSAPSELVEVANLRGLAAIAVTDHDTVGGVADAMTAAEGSDLRVIAGIELSTRHNGRGTHVLGYFLDLASQRLAAVIERMRTERMERALAIVDRLCEIGYDLDFAEVQAHAGGDVVARPHIARAMVERGYLSSVRDAFTQELIADGGKAWVPRPEMTPHDAVELIRSVGGAAVIAHPGVAHHDSGPDPIPFELIDELVDAGLAGLEVDHPDHPPLIRDRLRVAADEYGLVPTGGSDFHGEPSHTVGTCWTSAERLAQLEERIADS